MVLVVRVVLGVVTFPIEPKKSGSGPVMDSGEIDLFYTWIRS